MTKEQIEQAAKEYLETYFCNGRFGVPGSVKDAFVAGAESRQAEIDELKLGIAMAQDMISELNADIEQKRVDAARLLIENARLTGWKPIPRDKDGFVNWDLLELPRQGAYICALDCGGYETTFELLTESDMKHVVAVLPFVEI